MGGLKKDRRSKRQNSWKNQREQQLRRRIIGVSAVVVGVLLAFFAIVRVKELRSEKKSEITFAMQDARWQEYAIGNPVKKVPQPLLDVQLLTINEYSRPGLATDGVKGVVVHYTANPGSTAMNNRDYFESLKDTQETKVSSNFIVGLDGEIVQCIPTSEIAYASNERNNDTVSIECCHPDESGIFNDATYQSLVELVAFLCGKFDLTMDDVIRHYDVTGKNCPKYFVDNKAAWEQFKADVAKYIEENGE